MRKQGKKKILAAVFAASMMLTAAQPAYASDEQSMELTMKKDAQFIMTIPKDQNQITFGAERTTIGTLSVTGDIGTKQQVQVTVDKTEFVDAKDETNHFAFALQNEEADFNGAVWSSAQVRAATPTAYTLQVYIPTETWGNTQAGTYQATLTFKAALEDVR